MFAVNGGPGEDLVVMSLTPLADHVVLSDDGIFGGGRALDAGDVEQVVVQLDQGDDRFYALSSRSSATPVEVVGGGGSDGSLFVSLVSVLSLDLKLFCAVAFFVAPTFALAVEAKTLRGHSGLLSHVVSSEDTDYAALGIAAQVGLLCL